jgi:hypothetical protein
MMFQLYSVLTARIKLHEVERGVETRHSNLRHVSWIRVTAPTSLTNEV